MELLAGCNNWLIWLACSVNFSTSGPNEKASKKPLNKEFTRLLNCSRGAPSEDTLLLLVSFKLISL